VLRQLIFASRARTGLRPADTSAIIGRSRANNARDGVTGVLIYSGESFLQVAEGTDAMLSALWRRLIVDERHRHLVSIHDARIHARGFVDWRAGYVREEHLSHPVSRWQSFAAQLPEPEAEALRAFLRDAETF
jgi:hypothetical protein